MENMYAPWRDAYVKNKVEGCPFCHIISHPNLDDEHHVLYRAKHSFLVMNKFPYTPGHFMVIPNEHTDSIESLDQECWLEMSTLVQKCVGLLKEDFNAMGVNIGMNLGKSAGAGIAEHVHYHLVPRWERDTNFITAIADLRVYSTDFEEVFLKLKHIFQKKL